MPDQHQSGMDMTPTQVLHPSRPSDEELVSLYGHTYDELVEMQATVKGKWTVKERQSGVWVPVLERENIFTAYGLTALASAIGGGYVAPLWLAVSQNNATYTAATSAGVGTVSLNSDPTIGGDTQLVLSAGLATQEVVTFSSKSGVSPVVFTLSGVTVNAHGLNDPCTRNPLITDTISVLATEAQYDPTYAPLQRLQRMSGYSTGTGNFTIQFYFTGIQATNVFFVTIGLADLATIGTGNLHNEFVLGYNHNTTNDVEIDGSITLVNN